MPFSTKERLAKMRIKRKNDAVMYEEHLLKERERDLIRRQKKKEELEKNETLKNEEREKVRIRVERFRAKKNNLKLSSSPIGSYKCLQTFSKAVKKAKNNLPYSPEKKVAVIKKVVHDILGADYKIKMSNKPENYKLTEEVKDTVINFYYRDDVSRQAPGIKDCKSVIDAKTGTKVKKQKRIMLVTVNEAFEYFKELHPEINIGTSSFYILRPDEVLLVSDTPHNVCVCTQHSNYINLFDSLKKYIPGLFGDHNDLFKKICCDVKNEVCMAGSCEKCPNDFWESLPEAESDQEICWKEWVTQNNHPQMITSKATITEALNKLKDMTIKFRLHCYIKNIQAHYFENTKERLLNNEAVMQIDFAENYALVQQDEIQSAHWSHRQVTIFTCCVWFVTDRRCLAFVSDDMGHNKQAVWTLLNKIVDYIQQIKNNEITKLYIFSDNCAAQFKNKYILSSLNDLKNHGNLTHLEWNFFAASHGKGAVDGIGGTVKRLAWMGVKSRKVILNTAYDFYEYVKEKTEGINLFYISKEDMVKDRNILDDLWEAVQTIPNLQKLHHFKALDCNKISVAKTSSSLNEIVVVKKDIWPTEFLVPIASLRNENVEDELNNRERAYIATPKQYPRLESDDESIKSSSNSQYDVPSCSTGILRSIANIKRKLRYSDVYSDSDNDNGVLQKSTEQKVKIGEFVLVSFKPEGGRKQKQYRYAGICQKPVDEDGEVQIMSLKVVGDSGNFFITDEDDVFEVPFENIICILPNPTLKLKGNRTYYEFPTEIDVLEK